MNHTRQGTRIYGRYDRRNDQATHAQLRKRIERTRNNCLQARVQLELRSGSHLSLFNGKLKTDLAAFYMDTHDQQIAKFVNSGLGRMMVNAGSSESYGVEASFLASINKNLNMNVSYGYTHSTFKKYDGGTTSSEEQIDYSGNYVPFVPRHTMNAGANYSFFFDKSNWMQSLTLGMSYTGAGKIYWTEKNNVSQSFYGTLNGRISLQTKAYR